MSFFFPTSHECKRRTIFPGVHAQICAAEMMMMSYVELDPGAVVDEHSHPHEQVGLMIAGRATFWIGEEEKTLGPGEMYRIPGNVRHRVVALDEPVRVLDIFHPIREEYL